MFSRNIQKLRRLEKPRPGKADPAPIYPLREFLPQRRHRPAAGKGKRAIRLFRQQGADVVRRAAVKLPAFEYNGLHSCIGFPGAYFFSVRSMLSSSMKVLMSLKLRYTDANRT